MSGQFEITWSPLIDGLWIWALLGAVGGMVLFYRGFRLLARKRLIQNTPTSKIRSASLGLVEVSGLAVGPYTMPAPITGKSCFYYHTIAWQLRKSGKNEEWHKVADESLHLPFYLDDNTGRVLVNPEGAEMDLHLDFHQQYGNSVFFATEMPPSVRTFLRQHGVSEEHKIRVDEYSIKPKNALFVLGTLGENPSVTISPNSLISQSLAPGNVDLALSSSIRGNVHEALEKSSGATQTLSGMRNEPTMGQAHQEVIRLTPDDTPGASSPSTQQAKIAAALRRAGVADLRVWAAGDAGQPGMVSTHPVNAEARAAVTNAQAKDFDLQPKVALMKGANNATFMISWRSQTKVIRTMAWKSAAYIWGGPALTLLSVYVLLVHFGWL